MAERQYIITIQARGYVTQAGYAHMERALDKCALLYNAALRWRDVLDAEDGAGLIYIECSKTDQAGEGTYVMVIPETLTALKQLREDAGDCSDDDVVFGLSMSQKSRRVDSMARAAGLGAGHSGHSGHVGLAIRMTRRGAPLQAVQTHGRWKSPSMPARYTRSEKALEALEWLV